MLNDVPFRGPVEMVVSEEQSGQRLDVLLAQQFRDYSRVMLRGAIVAGGVTVDGRRVKVAYRLLPGQRISLALPELPHPGPIPEDIPLDILYEDEYLAAINKPPGMVVHPAKGHWSGTLTAALAFHFDRLSSTGGPTRPGIVHRLDRDTSGVIIAAKTDLAHFRLARQFERRTVEKEYAAITRHVPELDRDIIDAPIAAHPTHREKMAIRAAHPTSRSAQTRYEVEERFDGFALLSVLPHTGRTHQIRVHLASIGCPVLCDRLYAGHARITKNELTGQPDEDAVLLERQALHARRIKLTHPMSGELLEMTAPLPEDLQRVLSVLRAFRP